VKNTTTYNEDPSDNCLVEFLVALFLAKMLLRVSCGH
jgi:hypothetical protein